MTHEQFVRNLVGTAAKGYTRIALPTRAFSGCGQYMLAKLQNGLKKLIHVYDYKDAIRAFEDTMTSKSIQSVITFR